METETTSQIVKADLSNYLCSRSDMSHFDFNSVIDRVFRRLGRGGIVGITTFHDFRYEDFIKLERNEVRPRHDGLVEILSLTYGKRDLGNAIYLHQKDMLLVKGQRIPTQHGRLEVLGLKSEKTIPEHLSLEETLKIAAEEHDGIIIAPHPFYREGIGPYLAQEPELLSQFDAIEVYNGQAVLWIPGMTPRHANARALAFYRLAKEAHPHLGALTSSNGSSIDEIGRNHTSFAMPDYNSLQNAEDVTRALREGIRKATPEGAERHAAYVHALLHQIVVKIDHNPISYKLRGIPNQHLDAHFTKKE